MSSEVGNIPGVLRSTTTCLGVASSVAVRCVSLPIALASISVGGKAPVQPSASLSLADVLSANTSLTTEIGSIYRPIFSTAWWVDSQRLPPGGIEDCAQI